MKAFAIEWLRADHDDILVIAKIYQDELYIESCYPGDFGLLPHGKPTLQEAKEFYDFAQEVFNEVCSHLKISIDELKAQ